MYLIEACMIIYSLIIPFPQYYLLTPSIFNKTVKKIHLICTYMCRFMQGSNKYFHQPIVHPVPVINKKSFLIFNYDKPHIPTN